MDTQTTPSGIVPPPGTWRGQALLASGFHPGQASLSFEAKGNRVKTLSFFPGLDLRAVVDLSRPYDCPTSRSSTLMSPSIGLEGHRISY